MSRLHPRSGLSYKRQNGAGTATVTGAHTLHRVIIGTTAAATITLQDAIGVVAVLGASFPVGSYEFNVLFSGKLEAVVAGASDITLVYD